MAREIVLSTWCDPCLGEGGERVEGVELPALNLPELPGKRALVVALCERHRKELYDPLVELLTEYGQAMDEEGNPTGPRGRYGQSKAPGAMRCPECGHVSPNRSALQSHVRGQHNTSLAKLLGEKTLTCPECGQDCAKPQGLAAHRRTAHGITPNGGEDDQPTLLEDAKPAARKKAAGRPRKKSA